MRFAKAETLSPEHREYAELLIERARQDLRAAQVLIGVEQPDESIIGFHLQQAVEKSLKAVLGAREFEIPRIHDLGRLSPEVAATGIEMPAGLKSIAWLTPWGASFRYEDPSEDLDVEKGLEAATEAIGLAEGILAEDDSES